MINLKEWQVDAYNKFLINSNGIILACTGSGKTVLGLKLLEDNKDKRFLIIVPTIVLLNQWKNEIIKFGVGSEEEITLLGGGNNTDPSKRITIAVINSLLNINWEHQLANYDYGILDELHRYAADEFVKVLYRSKDKIKNKLGLTATLRRPDGYESKLIKNVGPIIYNINKERAISEGYICDYDVSIISCELNNEEREEYNTVNENVSNTMKIFNGDFNNIRKVMKSGPCHVNYGSAVRGMKHIQNRKQICAKIKSKIKETVKLCNDNKQKKIIIFDELQESANEIHKSLNELGMKAVLYHSGIGSKAKKKAIEEYKSGESNILVSVKALDEGLDIKEADMGIIVNGNSQERQILQRLGRILRKKEGKIAHLYMLSGKGTVDEKNIQKRMKFIGNGGD